MVHLSCSKLILSRKRTGLKSIRNIIIVIAAPGLGWLYDWRVFVSGGHHAETADTKRLAGFGTNDNG